MYPHKAFFKYVMTVISSIVIFMQGHLPQSNMELEQFLVSLARTM